MIETNNPYMFSANTTNITTTTTTTTTITAAAKTDTTNDIPPTTTNMNKDKSKIISTIETQAENNRSIYRHEPLSNNGILYNNNSHQQQQHKYSSGTNNTNTMPIKRDSSLFDNYIYNNKPPTPISASSTTSISSPALSSNMKFQQNNYNSDNHYSQQQSSNGRWYNGASSSPAVVSVIHAPPPPPSMKEKEAIEPDSRQINTNTTSTTTNNNKKSKRRKEMTKYMESLNQNFLKNKERIYLERLESIRQEMLSARKDQHIVYKECLRDLEQMRQKMIDEFSLFKEYQIEVTDRQFKLEIYQADEEYTAEKQEVREKLYNMLEEKRRKLKEEKDNCDLTYDIMMETQARMHKRNLRKRGAEHPENKSSKKKQMTGPALVIGLKEEDIVADLQAMMQVK
ncbi:Sds3-like-domain-containing protein [Mycotypha africana]|uniref:Sds3-like-domain-containing protein n=1 Tax=Mycotypha africana TaxID=64632 RepID=UPI0023017AD5|nr:Sds3-like-domain-containing protein [Mycotypha africana]KAI8967576.1 Sds3-like-domain-containing protein [Mycotypha africana]